MPFCLKIMMQGKIFCCKAEKNVFQFQDSTYLYILENNVVSGYILRRIQKQVL